SGPLPSARSLSARRRLPVSLSLPLIMRRSGDLPAASAAIPAASVWSSKSVAPLLPRSTRAPPPLPSTATCHVPRSSIVMSYASGPSRRCATAGSICTNRRAASCGSSLAIRSSASRVLSIGLLHDRNLHRRLSLERERVVHGAEMLAPVHGYGNPRLDPARRLGGLAGGHHVRAADGQQRDVDAGDLVHLGDHVGVAGVVEALAAHVHVVADPARLARVEDLAVLVALRRVV